MADEPTSTSQSPPRTRRSSFAGATFADLFGSGRPSVSAPRNVPASNSGDGQQGQYPGPITNAAAQAQRRRMSLTTLGLSGSPTAPSPFGSMRGRRESFSSANSGSIDESAVEDEFAAKDQSTTPTTPFARRMSFGARAMRDIRSSTGGSGGGGGEGSPPQNGRSAPPPAPSSQHARQMSASVPSSNGPISSRDGKGRGLSSLPSNQSSLPASSSRTSFSIPFSNRRLTIASATGEGFNWSENLRSRAERTASIAGPSGGGGVGLPLGANNHSRAKSVATMEAPVREMPTQPRASKKPDHFQERILKGDFYMD
jgi:hypothetical protein